MIVTLSITIVTEGIIALGYCIWRKKPVIPILLTSIGANILTQLFLWVMLIVFFQQYLVVLLIAELVIWATESYVLFYVPANQLHLREAFLLSLGANFVSFTLGLFLRI